MDLRQMVTGREISLNDLSDLVIWLPAGCALWQAIGGPAALTIEQRELRRIGLAVRVLDWHMHKGTKPQADPNPPYAWEKRAAQTTQERRAEAYKRRQQRRSEVS